MLDSASLVQSQPVDLTRRTRRSTSPTLLICWFVALLLVCYAESLTGLLREWQKNEDMSHGFLVPIAVAYIVWQKRPMHAWRNAEPTAWGLLPLLLSSMLSIVGILSQSWTLSRFGFILAVASCVLAFGGRKLLWFFAFPLALMILMIPLPDVIYGEITSRLRVVASAFTEDVLTAFGYSVLREGNILRLPGINLFVAEACSGIRSLLSLSFFIFTYAYLLETKLLIRVLLCLCIVPVTIFVNVLRLTTTAVLGSMDERWLHGRPHEMLGWGVFLISLGLMFAIHWGLRLRRRTYAVAV